MKSNTITWTPMNVVQHMNNGVRVNMIFLYWNGIKTEKQYQIFTQMVENTRFGTYNTLTILDILNDANFDTTEAVKWHKIEFKKEVTQILNNQCPTYK